MWLQGSLLAFCISLLGLPSQSITSLKQQKCLVSQFWRLAVQRKVSTGLAPSKAWGGICSRPLAGFQEFAGHLQPSLAGRSIILLSASMVTRCSPCVGVCIQMSYFTRTGLEAHPTPVWPHLNNYIYKDPISGSVHTLRYWGWGLQHVNTVVGARHTIQPIIKGTLFRVFSMLLCSVILWEGHKACMVFLQLN